MEKYECWFEDYPELLKMYTLYGYQHLLCPLSYKYTSIPYYKQRGPQCGLAALAMIMKKPTKENVDDLFETAKKANFTYNGEMFSVQDMCRLARLKLENYRAEVFKGNLNCDFIKRFLLNGGLMLVPYDSTMDFTPTVARGHQAHWAAVTGCFDVPTMYRDNEGIFHVLARQGKSKLIGIWELEALAVSNAQLEELSPIRGKDNLQYKLPEGGMGGPNGLKLQAVLLFPDGLKL